jgi:starvation-inducible DNA-binding protein
LKDCGPQKVQYPVIENIFLGETPMTFETPNSLAAADYLRTPTGLDQAGAADVAKHLTRLLADVFALYLKTKNFHWHMSGPHFRDYHLMLDDQGDQIFAMTDPIAERARKVGGTTIRSIGHIARQQTIQDNDQDFVRADVMLAELLRDNLQLAASIRETHNVCDEVGDVATASLLENWLDETERRSWFLFEITRNVDGVNL